MRSAFGIMLLTAFFYGCTGTTAVINNSYSFKSFEISYTSGWAKSFSFFADTNKIYFSPQLRENTYYGILPDSIFKMLDTTFQNIRTNKNIHTTDKICDDCTALSIKIISGDTIFKITQAGNIDSIFIPLIEKLQQFINDSKHTIIKSVMWFETKSVLSPLPKPF